MFWASGFFWECCTSKVFRFLHSLGVKPYLEYLLMFAFVIHHMRLIPTLFEAQDELQSMFERIVVFKEYAETDTFSKDVVETFDSSIRCIPFVAYLNYLYVILWIALMVCEPMPEKVDVEKVKRKLSSQQVICSICIEQIKPEEAQEVVLTKCDHLFHYKCLSSWVIRKQQCPNCKASLSSFG